MSWDQEADLSWGGKQEVLRQYFDARPYAYVFETGIWNGQGSCFQFSDRARVTAIEINPESCEQARRNHPTSRIVQGDSATELAALLTYCPAPAFFWLDAHLVAESGEENSSSLAEELEAIMAWEHGAASTVLIDDVRMMGREGWPSIQDTLEQTAGFWDQETKADIVRLTPRKTNGS